MDKRFTPRTNEELHAAVLVFQKRHSQTRERLSRKLELGVLKEEMA